MNWRKLKSRRKFVKQTVDNRSWIRCTMGYWFVYESSYYTASLWVKTDVLQYPRCQNRFSDGAKRTPSTAGIPALLGMLHSPTERYSDWFPGCVTTSNAPTKTLSNRITSHLSLAFMPTLICFNLIQLLSVFFIHAT